MGFLLISRYDYHYCKKFKNVIPSIAWYTKSKLSQKNAPPCRCRASVWSSNFTEFIYPISMFFLDTLTARTFSFFFWIILLEERILHKGTWAGYRTYIALCLGSLSQEALPCLSHDNDGERKSGLNKLL